MCVTRHRSVVLFFNCGVQLGNVFFGSFYIICDYILAAPYDLSKFMLFRNCQVMELRCGCYNPTTV